MLHIPPYLHASSASHSATPPYLSCLWQAHPAPPIDKAFVLGHVHFGLHAPAQADIQVALHSPDAAQGWNEIWVSPTPVSTLRSGDILARHNQHVLWGCITLPIDTRASCAKDVENRYDQLLQFLAVSGFPHLLRIWNFVPHINALNADGVEIYRDFNTGRATAYANAFDYGSSRLNQAQRHMPAATGIGCQGSQLSIYFLAGKQAGQHIENPHQVAAYHYPPVHGINPPCFARATALRLQQQLLFFASGTASILGHQTHHINQLEQQLALTLSNLNVIAQRSGRDLAQLNQVKVYVRHARDIARVQALCAHVWPATSNVAYFVGDICRSNLLVEIEAQHL